MSHVPERSQTDEAARGTVATDGCRVLPLARPADSSFDTVENQFFTEGDALNTGPAFAGDAWDEPTVICGPRHRKRKQRVRWIAASAGAGMLCAGLFLWYTNSHARTRNVVVVPPAAPAPPPPVASAPLPDPTVVAGPAHPLPAPPAPVASPSPRPLSPADEAAGAVLSDSLEACRQANRRHHNKAVLTDCTRAFADNPSSPEIATMLAKAELDRGRSRQALDWARKAVAIDENHADAYVFLGGAEQAIGHAAAAKAAYRRYLQLLPKGRYAAELRMVLGSL